MLAKAGRGLETVAEAAGIFQTQQRGSGCRGVCMHNREVDAGSGCVQPVPGDADECLEEAEAVS